jgi:hypothetical protein
LRATERETTDGLRAVTREVFANIPAVIDAIDFLHSIHKTARGARI